MSYVKMATRTTRSFVFPAAISLFAVLACGPPPAFADTSPPCNAARTATWSKSAIDPKKDLWGLIEAKGWNTINGVHVLPHVIAIKDIRLIKTEDQDPEKAVCKAIVETDHGNSIYTFWYIDTPTGAALHALSLYPLPDKLPDDITLATIGPYMPYAETVANGFARLVPLAPFCKLRDKAWSEALRQQLLAQVRKDRPDLVHGVESIISNDGYGISHGMGEAYKPDCKEPATKVGVRFGDQVIAGSRSIWATPADGQ